MPFALATLNHQDRAQACVEIEGRYHPSNASDRIEATIKSIDSLAATIGEAAQVPA